MLQNICGKQVFVVEFDTLPELPVTGLTVDEEEVQFKAKFYSALIPEGSLGSMTRRIGGRVTRLTYAQALTDAIETGIITEPGKYGIYLRRLGRYQGREYEIYAINE